jgi:hypothetical protein
MVKRRLTILTATIMAVSVLCATAPAFASLIVDGITYSLTETTTSSALTNQFTLRISGIDGPSDTEGGREGVQSFAFNPPSNFGSATPPGGFSYRSGGLSSSGCNGNGNFFCFAANTTPTGPALAANSSLTYIFDITLSSGGFSGFDPDFKINWDGTKNNYDLVSLALSPTLVPGGGTQVPEPASLALFGAGLMVLAGLRYRKSGNELA